jgi:uncharacterized protein YjbI with pentapeptide repeats
MPVKVPLQAQETVTPPREAFWLTALIFERGVDRLSGRPAGLFARNLVVTDADLVHDGIGTEIGTSLNLRRRDLRYGTFDRTDMHRADLTGAILARASMRETNLIEAKAEKAIFRGTDLWRAKFIPDQSIGRPVSPIILRGADLRGADLAETNLQAADLKGALFSGADLHGAQMDSEAVADATQQGAKF